MKKAPPTSSPTSCGPPFESPAGSTKQYEKVQSQRLDTSTFVDSHGFLVGHKGSLSQDHLLQSNLKNVHRFRSPVNWNGSPKKNTWTGFKVWRQSQNLKLLIVNPFHSDTTKLLQVYNLRLPAASLKFTAVILVEHTSVGSRHQSVSLQSREERNKRPFPHAEGSAEEILWTSWWFHFNPSEKYLLVKLHQFGMKNRKNIWVATTTTSLSSLEVSQRYPIFVESKSLRLELLTEVFLNIFHLRAPDSTSKSILLFRRRSTFKEPNETKKWWNKSHIYDHGYVSLWYTFLYLHFLTMFSCMKLNHNRAIASNCFRPPRRSPVLAVFKPIALEIPTVNRTKMSGKSAALLPFK